MRELLKKPTCEEAQNEFIETIRARGGFILAESPRYMAVTDISLSEAVTGRRPPSGPVQHAIILQ